MFGKNTKVTLQGVSYDLVPLTYDDVVDGALVRLKRGTAMRRIVGIDGGDAILRSVRSDSVVEALSFETLVDEWLLMVRVGRENGAETK